jgi:beta-glucanase (GH16 family)
MLGTDIDEVGWPACGEIDIMEYVGGDPNAVHGTVHGPGYAGVGRGIGRRYATESPLSGEFHTYEVQWQSARLSWSVDGHEYFCVTPRSVPGPWPFDHPFFLVLNLAFGGTCPGNEPIAATLPADLLVEWVRVEGSEVTFAGNVR